MHFTVQYVLSRKYLYLILVCWRHSVFKYMCFSEKTCGKILRRGLSAFAARVAQVLEKEEKKRDYYPLAVSPNAKAELPPACGFPHIRKLLFSFSSPADRDLFIWFSCAKTRVVHCSVAITKSSKRVKITERKGKKEKHRWHSQASPPFSFDTLPDNTKKRGIKSPKKRNSYQFLR